MPKSYKYWVIIPAAGTGQRMGGDIPKQYVSVCGKTVIEHTINNFIYHLNDIKHEINWIMFQIMMYINIYENSFSLPFRSI